MQPSSTPQYKQLAAAVACSDCDDDDCPVSDELTAQCTDQCVVIACHDPDHSGFHCDGQSGDQAHCNLVCDSSTNCVDCNGFDAFLQCCVDYHSYLSEPQWNRQNPVAAASHAPNAPSDGLWCDRTEQVHTVPHQAFHPQHRDHSQAVSTQAPPLQARPPAFPVSPLPEKCMWHGCKASFPSLSDLVGHVNLVHLRPLPDAQVKIPEHPSQNGDMAVDSKSPVPCLWDDCGVYLSPENVAGTSSSSELSNLLTALESHLLQDHLGLQTTPSYLTSVSSCPSYLNNNIQHHHHHHQQQQHTDFIQDVYSSHAEVAFTPNSADSEHAIPSPPVSDIHPCLWQDCGSCFTSSEELTTHLTLAHVGGGKARYDCFWHDCDRHDERGFSSKQKICRHLQSHTGHRPFQCEICHQNFSEAATLQQHMRRHTQEKPYACDFPGCGKSFAIMGALTIHKRIHNGQKPFKCTYCSRAFTESSNLSKHLRTHTGARPYTCSEPGCGKTFARPDQLTRHLGVHKKSTVMVAPMAVAIPQQ